ncbi:hypothetical protein BDV28DRAFT_141284 [Aspergillus coremiiformis]|uniref:Zn(2)-C6 fungal-type domain-containing protein n=1 Tax=Aspergillus coremiiformis TaxID=138285 RepID=A0A5N6YV91_9EURO|nr:hypothetical protein BDV28DRAFT_141284 [Aspergillus coremiiformis]
MSRQPKLRPKSHIPGFPDAMYDLASLSSFSHLDARASLGEDKHDQRVFRVKRKHVLKACDRCRVKKTKCDGKQPCNRCSAHNHPCLFRERKATQTKVYSRGFVEMLESHHSLVVKALQRLYKLCLNKDGFPGDPLTESPDGYPLTHAILDRLGLIKQAEENAEEPDEDSEDLQYLRCMATSTDCSATTDPSPEPVTPPEPSLSNCSPINPSPKVNGAYKWEYQPVNPVHHEQYAGYPHTGFHSVAIPRSAVEPAGLPAESKCPLTLPPVSSSESSYYYYAGAGGNAETTKGSLHPGVTTGPGSHHNSVGMSVEMLGNYNLHLQEQQSLYQGLASSWTSYPCG